MLTEKDYCDYEACVALEELGFREPTLAHYMENYPNNLIYHYRDDACVKDCYRRVSSRDGVFGAPTLYEAQKWLREEKKLHITIFSQSQESWQYRITKPHQTLEDGLHGEDFVSYEDALINAIKECIKHVD